MVRPRAAGWRPAVAMVALSGVWLAGCAAAARSSDEAPVMNAPGALLEAALDDAARRTGIPKAQLKVVVAEAVTWPDGSLGCPEPGMLYTQALVPGYRIVVLAGDQPLAYHAGMRGPARFCPADRAVSPGPSDRV